MKNVRPSSAVRASQPVGTDEKQPEARGQLAAPVGAKRPARDGGRKGGHSRGGCACIAGRCCRASVSPVFLCVCSLATATEGVTSNIVILDLSMYNEAAILSVPLLRGSARGFLSVQLVEKRDLDLDPWTALDFICDRIFRPCSYYVVYEYYE